MKSNPTNATPFERYQRFGNRILNFVTFLLFNIQCYDTQSGFRAMNRNSAEMIKITVNRYGVSSEIIGEIARNKLSLLEVPVRTIYNDKDQGTTVVDGIRILIDLILKKF
jgi:hypothetical protein